MASVTKASYSNGSAASFLLAVQYLFFAAVLPTSYAQSLTDAFSTPTMGTPSATSPDSTWMIDPLSSLTTSSSSSSSNTTTSSATARVTDDLSRPLLPPEYPNSGSSNPEEQRKESAFNYYFLILAGFGVLIAISLWWARQRKNARKEQMRLSGHNALARDLDGWVNTRRWMHGAWRHNQNAAFVRREEGLDERGEAPPPYQPKNEVTVTQTGTVSTRDVESGLTIPLRTLSRDGMERTQPPEYRDASAGVESANLRPGTATTFATRPDTAHTHTNSSARDLLRD